MDFEGFRQFSESAFRISYGNFMIAAEGKVAITDGGAFRFPNQKPDSFTIMDCSPSIVLTFHPSPYELGILEACFEETMTSFSMKRFFADPPRFQLAWDRWIASRCTINSIVHFHDSAEKMFFFSFDRDFVGAIASCASASCGR